MSQTTYDIPGYQCHLYDIVGYQPGAAASSSGFTIVTVPDYVVTWDPPTTNYVLGDVPALQWFVTQASGGLVAVPTACTITIIKPDGTIVSPSSYYINSGVAVTSLLVGGTVTFDQTGDYLAQISLSFAGAPTQVRSDRQLLTVNLPYNPTITVGKIRQYCLDTNMQKPFFSDVELLGFYADCGNVAMYAAALALDVLATDQARLAMAVKIGPFSSNNSTATHNAIAQRAETLRNLSPVLPAVQQVCSRYPDGDPTDCTDTRIW